MPLRRLHRRLLAWVLTACMLFAQSAALAYACRDAVPQRAMNGAASVAPCPEHLSDAVPSAPLGNGNVCEVHCQTPSLPDAGAPDLPVSIATAVWWLPPFAEPISISAPHEELEAKSAAPPVRALFVRLLI